MNKYFFFLKSDHSKQSRFSSHFSALGTANGAISSETRLLIDPGVLKQTVAHFILWDYATSRTIIALKIPNISYADLQRYGRIFERKDDKTLVKIGVQLAPLFCRGQRAIDKFEEKRLAENMPNLVFREKKCFKEVIFKNSEHVKAEELKAAKLGAEQLEFSNDPYRNLSTFHICVGPHKPAPSKPPMVSWDMKALTRSKCDQAQNPLDTSIHACFTYKVLFSYLSVVSGFLVIACFAHLLVKSKKSQQSLDIFNESVQEILAAKAMIQSRLMDELVIEDYSGLKFRMGIKREEIFVCSSRQSYR